MGFGGSRQQAAGSSREGKDAGGLGVLVCQARVGQRAKPEWERVGPRPRQSMAWHGMAWRRGPGIACPDVSYAAVYGFSVNLGDYL